MTIDEQFRNAVVYCAGIYGRGFNTAVASRIKNELNIKQNYVAGVKTGKRNAPEEKRRAITDAINNLMGLNLTYQSFLDLGQWVHDGKDGKIFLQSSHAETILQFPVTDIKEDKPSNSQPFDSMNSGYASSDKDMFYTICRAKFERFIEWASIEYGTVPEAIDTLFSEIDCSFPSFKRWRKEREMSYRKEREVNKVEH